MIRSSEGLEVMQCAYLSVLVGCLTHELVIGCVEYGK